MPPKILLFITQPHFGETCSRDKGQMPQLSPGGTLKLAGAFRRSLIFFYHFLRSFILNDWQAPECAKLSLALGLCTATSFLCLELHQNPHSLTPFQVSANMSPWESSPGRGAGLGAPQDPMLSPVWERVPLK